MKLRRRRRRSNNNSIASATATARSNNNYGIDFCERKGGKIYYENSLSKLAFFLSSSSSYSSLLFFFFHFLFVDVDARERGAAQRAHILIHIGIYALA